MIEAVRLCMCALQLLLLSRSLAKKVKFKVAAWLTDPPIWIPSSAVAGLAILVLEDAVCEVGRKGVYYTNRSGVTRRKLQTPGTAAEPKRQETPTINTNDRQPTQPTDQAPSTV